MAFEVIEMATWKQNPGLNTGFFIHVLTNISSFVKLVIRSMDVLFIIISVINYNKNILPVATLQIMITPLSKPVAKSRLDGLSLGAAFSFDDAALGGRGPKASPQTVWPQVMVLSGLSWLFFLKEDVR